MRHFRTETKNGAFPSTQLIRSVLQTCTMTLFDGRYTSGCSFEAIIRSLIEDKKIAEVGHPTNGYDPVLWPIKEPYFNVANSVGRGNGRCSALTSASSLWPALSSSSPPTRPPQFAQAQAKASSMHTTTHSAVISLNRIDVSVDDSYNNMHHTFIATGNVCDEFFSRGIASNCDDGPDKSFRLPELQIEDEERIHGRCALLEESAQAMDVGEGWGNELDSTEGLSTEYLCRWEDYVVGQTLE
ncbi:hypothetical protein B0H11DRAFT_2189480 [Mycena galericulata]|nr:hypothetical protein B0H11DRAFT_2189480 [Mycena galericulata]